MPEGSQTVFKKIREGDLPVVVFPGIGQAENYYQGLFRHTNCSLFFLDYRALLGNSFSSEDIALQALDRILESISTDYGRMPLWMAYSFGGRIALKLWARRPASAYMPEQLLLVAADGLCVHPLYLLATQPFLRPSIKGLVRKDWFQKLLLKVLPFWGFRRLHLVSFFERWSPQDIYALWCFWSKQPSLPDAWPGPVRYVAAEKDRIFPLRCLCRLQQRYPGKIRLTVLENSSHFIAPSRLEPIILSWLSGKHHQHENENVQP